jgi:DNA-directed RNA polymerase specialized sigma24 family protein
VVPFLRGVSRRRNTPAERADGQLVRDLYGALRRFAAVVAPADVEPDDLVQEALTRALRVRPLSELDDPLPYLRRVMLNLASNARRSSGRRDRALSRLGAGCEPEVARYPSDLAILDDLSPDTRLILYLAEVEGWRYSEISELVGCSEETARARSARARRALRSVLEASDD